ncbi:hypothetical protein Bca101_062731 [Brassica carinata]
MFLVSIENLHQGFIHIFESTFDRKEAVAEYVAHPIHVEFSNMFLGSRHLGPVQDLLHARIRVRLGLFNALLLHILPGASVQGVAALYGLKDVCTHDCQIGVCCIEPIFLGHLQEGYAVPSEVCSISFKVHLTQQMRQVCVFDDWCCNSKLLIFLKRHRELTDRLVLLVTTQADAAILVTDASFGAF